MARIVVTEFVSLDGVMEDPGGAEEYAHGGWTFETERGEEGDGFKMQEVLDCSGLLLGRRTYEGFAAAWPEREGEFAERFNSMPKYVVSSTLRDPGWSNTTVLAGELGEEVARLKREVEGDLYVHGSARLAQGLLERGLVDELHLMVFPVLLGSGRRLFGEGSREKQWWKLRESRTVGAGVLILLYTPSTEAGEAA